MIEQWKIIEDYPNYEVSNYGKIRNINTGLILKTNYDYKGYEFVILSHRGIQKTIKVHKLVADAFVDKYYDNLEVTHLDGDRSNNRADNLDWWKRRDVHRRSYRLHGRKQLHRMRSIVLIETGEIFESITQASDILGISKYSISRVLNRRSRCTKEGYHFEEV
jgi:hypothetical protein